MIWRQKFSQTTYHRKSVDIERIIKSMSDNQYNNTML